MRASVFSHQSARCVTNSHIIVSIQLNVIMAASVAPPTPVTVLRTVDGNAAAPASAGSAGAPLGMRQLLMKGVSGGVDGLRDFILGGGFKPADLAETVASLSADQARKLFREASMLIDAVTTELQEHTGEEGDASVTDPGVLFQVLAQVAAMMHAWCEDAEHAISEGFKAALQKLSVLVPFLPATRPAAGLRGGILKLCERYFVQGRVDRDVIIAATLPEMMLDATRGDATDAAVKRVWAVREAFALFDYEDADTGPFKATVLQCFAAPAVLRTAENRRLLAYLLAKVPELVPDVHAVVRSAMPGPAARMEHYGEMYLRGWVQAEGAGRLAIEQGCVQDLVHRGLHAAFPETFRAVRRLLGELVDPSRRKGKGVDGMLVRAYEPLLFRALGVPNAVVRKNAAVLFFDVFPLRDGDMPALEHAELLQAQFQQLVALLADPAPAVRESAVEGSAKVLRVFWEVIPAATRVALLERLIDDCATDMRAPAVRAAVPAAVAAVLENGDAVEVLRPMLPRLSLLLHDRSDKVRAATVALLAKVAGIRGLGVAAAVGADDLLARLTLDAAAPSIVVGLCKLLAASFFPPASAASAPSSSTAGSSSGSADGQAAAAGAAALLRMLRDHEAAAFVFLSYAREAGVPVPVLSQAVLQLKGSLQAAVAGLTTITVPAPAGADEEAAAVAASGAAMDAVGAAGDEAAAEDAEKKEEDADDDEEDEEDAGFSRKKRGGKGKAKLAAAAAAASASASATGVRAAVKRDRAGEPKPASPASASAGEGSADGNSSLDAALVSVALPPVATIMRAIALLWTAVSGPLKLTSGAAAGAASGAATGAAASASAAVSASSAVTKSAAAAPAGGKKRGAKTAGAAATAALADAEAAAAGEDAASLDEADGEEAVGSVAGLGAALSSVRGRLLQEFSGSQLASLMRSFADMGVGAGAGAGASGSSSSSASATAPEASGRAKRGRKGSKAAASSSSVASVGAGPAGSLSAEDVASLTSSLLSIGEHLPPSSAQGLVDVLWGRLLAMSTLPSGASGAASNAGVAEGGSALAPADAAALPGLLQCLCAWGRADAVLDAGMKALRASAEQLFKGEPLDHDGVTGLDVHVAILCIRHIAALSSDAEGGATVGASVGKLSEAMTALKQTATYCQRAMAICHQQAVSGSASADPRCLLAVLTEGVALQLYALSVSCMDAWISLVMQQAALAVPAAAAPGAELAASAAYVEGQLAFIARWACESMLRTVLQFADGVDQHAGSYADPAVIARMVPLEVGCRAVFASLAAAAADCVAMGMALPSALGLLAALTSADQVVLGASAPALGTAGSAAAAAGAGAPILSGFAPVEWLGNISFLSAYYAAAFGGSDSEGGAAAAGEGQDMPVEVAASYGAVLRLAMCLHAWVSSAAAAGAAAAVAPTPPILNPAALSADQRAVIVTGMTRLLMLAPDAEPEPADAAAEEAAEEGEEEEDADDAASTASSVARGGARRAAAAAAARPTPAELLVRRTVSSALGGLLGSPAGSAAGSSSSSSGRGASRSRDAGAGVGSGAAAPTAAARSAAVEFLSESLRLVEMEIDTSAEAFTAFVARPRPAAGAAGGGRRRGGRAGAGASAGAGMAVDDDEEGASDAGAEGSGSSALVLAGAPAASAAQALGPVPHAFIATAAASAPAEAAQALATRIGVLAEVFMIPAPSAADEEGGSGGAGAAAADPMAGTTPVEPNCVACLAVIIAAVETAAAAATRGSVPAAAVAEAKATLRSVLSRLAFQPHAALDTAFAVLQAE